MFKKVVKKAAAGRVREKDDDETPADLEALNSDQQMIDQTTSSKVEGEEDDEEYKKRKIIAP